MREWEGGTAPSSSCHGISASSSSRSRPSLDEPIAHPADERTSRPMRTYAWAEINNPGAYGYEAGSDDSRRRALVVLREVVMNLVPRSLRPDEYVVRRLERGLVDQGSVRNAEVVVA